MSGRSCAYVFCVVFVVSSCGGAPSRDQGGGTADRPATVQIDSGTDDALDWTTYEVPEAGLTVSYPSGWTRASEPLMPLLADPRELVALSTFVASRGGENCAHMPENAIEGMGAADALVVIEERASEPGMGTGTMTDYPERPARFGPSDGYPSEAVDCLDRPKAFVDQFIPFRDSSRRFYAYIAFGDDAPAEIRAQAWAILDRIEIDR